MNGKKKIHELVVRWDAARFPEACLQCGGVAMAGYELEDKQGRIRLTLPAPFCRTCGERAKRLRILWHVVGLVAIGGFVVLVGVLQDTAYFVAHNGQLGLIALPGIAVIGWWLMLRERQAFHERYSRVWIRRFVPRSTVTLASFDRQRLDAISTASGLDAAPDPEKKVRALARARAKDAFGRM
jgi:hypothetical protein